MTTDLILPIFRAGDHSYTLPSGERYPSVTELMKDAGLIDTTHCPDHARERGRLVHLCVQLLNERDLDHETLDPELKPYVAGYENFLRDSDFHPQMSEAIVVSHSQKFAGRVDVVGLLNGALSVVDVKTEKAPPWVSTQLYFYWFALNECGFDVKHRYSLELKKSGRYRLRQLDGPDGARDFLFALNARGSR